jgi:predicted CXXCH cytochrome family protein
MFKESGHLIRMAVVLAIGVLIFLAVRRAIIPAEFGKYGHYRPGALDDIRARPVAFAGKAVCLTCHEDVNAVKSQGKHTIVACEACHGPTAAHTEDPITNKAIKPDIATLCVRCHEADSAKPKNFPQVVSKEHAGDLSCGGCHNPHRPKV